MDAQSGTRPGTPVRARDSGAALPRGTGVFLELIALLVRRPRRTESPLPLLWLTGERGEAVLDAVEDGLNGASVVRRQVPHARIRIGRPGDGATIGDLLTRTSTALSGRSSAAGRLWFRHLGLLRWLLAQRLSGYPADEIPAELVRRLHERRRPSRAGQGDPGAVGQLGLVPYLLWRLAHGVLPAVLFRAAVSDRIPGPGRTYRWFARQRYPEPKPPGTFLALAERLTTEARDDTDPEQIDRLQVHAFLEDLRQAYARSLRHGRGWRRTAHPVVLLQGPGRQREGTGDTGDTGDGEDLGERLLGLVNDVRVETGEWDPLLLVYAGPRPPRRIAGQAPEDARTVLLEELADGGEDWRRWRQTLRRRRLTQPRTAWYLPVRLPGPDATERTGRTRGIEAPRPPWFTHRSFAAAVCLALLLPLLGWTGRELGWPGCAHRPFAGQISVRGVDGECIGYSDSGAFRFNDEPGQERLQGVQRTIFDQNREVRELWERSDRRRPYATLVYLGSLTGRSTKENEEAYAAEREELEGLAVAQYEGMQQPADAHDVPLVRVVVANAGFQMRHADDLVDMIAELAREGGDAPVVGVVGLVESRRSTAAALRKLNRAGLPAVAPTLSADGMYDNSRLYLQLAPPNRDQAGLVAAYAREVLGVRESRVYHTFGERSSREEDLYVSTLLDGLDESLDGTEYSKPFEAGDNLAGECGYRGMLFFAGRWSEFDDFLRALGNSCGDDQPRHLVANDSVNRYMANPALRRSAPGGLSLVYVSKAAYATCGALHSRVRGGRDEAGERFLRWISEDGPDTVLDPPRCGNRGEPVGERVGLAYDSAALLLRAVQTLTARVRVNGQSWDPRSVTPAAVHAEVLYQNRVRPFSGATGVVRFPEDRGEPVGRRISLMRVGDIADTAARPEEVFHCGAAREEDDPGCARPRR
ncbi:hypothetical protein V1L54_15195 [Streptomyces sp. TRM 70361]|uniref:hypothetical protein n=1 Tax=Streptomyces sp. TRM 70361 TaxID=3116553 RepID=UPI002E7BADC3|nr:hypothetical protein [Streptomyces sp. TRM 70361]MEE1940732.1 hypothetical protein [Streptomyces sp. TRM 70361]